MDRTNKLLVRYNGRLVGTMALYKERKAKAIANEIKMIVREYGIEYNGYKPF